MITLYSKTELLIIKEVAKNEKSSIWKISRDVRMSYPYVYRVTRNLIKRGHIKTYRNKNRSLSCRLTILGRVSYDAYLEMMSKIRKC